MELQLHIFILWTLGLVFIAHYAMGDKLISAGVSANSNADNEVRRSRANIKPETHRITIGSDKPKIQPCPMGCRCTAGPRLHARHHWHRILGAYRTHRLVYGPGRQDFKYMPHRNPHRPSGREMTCIGLPDMPDYLPSDVSRVMFYGSLRESWEDQSADDTDDDDDVEVDDMVHLDSSIESSPHALHQLTTVSKLNFIRSANMRHLEIQGNKIKTLYPNDFEMLTSLRHLHMENNRMKVVSVGAFNGLNQIQDIDVSQNHIRHLPKATFLGLTNLRKLNIAKNRLSILPEKVFANVGKLQHLDLSFNFIMDMPKDIFLNNQQMKVMILSDNHIKQIRPSWIGNMGKLEKLNLKGNRIDGIEDYTFNQLTSLKVLNLDKNQLKELGQNTFSGLRNLQKLYLGNNNISFIQNQAFGYLEKLTELHLDNNNIDIIPAGTFTGLRNLQKLSLDHNGLDGIRREVFVPVQKLQYLDLSYNHIKRVTNRNFYGLLDLRELRLEHNDIKSVDDDGFAVSVVNTFSKMTWLQLGYNQLSTVTRRMFTGLSYLKFLNLGHNDIEILDESGLAVFNKINTIILNGNKIYDILPATFKQLSHLKLLNLGSNKLRHIRFNAFLGLENIEELSLQNNDVSSIDTGVFLDTPNLRSMNLKKNRMNSFNLNILHRLPKLKYLDLSQNTLRQLRIPTSPLRQLFSMSLADNFLQKLPVNVTGAVSKKGSLLLYGNPWNCNCDIDWLLPGDVINMVQIANADQLICKSPRHLSGEKIQALVMEDVCPQQDAGHVTDAAQGVLSEESIACGLSDVDKNFGSIGYNRSARVEPLRWVVNLFSDTDNWFCSGVRLQQHLVITHSECWKLIGQGEPIKIAIGSTGNSVTPEVVVVKEIEHYPGPSDFALVKLGHIGKIKGSEDRVFPCILNSEGLNEIMADGASAIVASTSINHRSTKVRSFLAKTIADPCVHGYLCFSVNEEKLERSKYQTEFIPGFVKVGKSRWSLVSIGELKAFGNVLTTPLAKLIPWIDTVIQ